MDEYRCHRSRIRRAAACRRPGRGRPCRPLHRRLAPTPCAASSRATRTSRTCRRRSSRSSSRDGAAARDDRSRVESPTATTSSLCVPTPLTREPRARPLVHDGRDAQRRAATCAAGHLVVLESTTYPGTTRDELGPDARGGLRARGRRRLPPRDVARAHRPGPHRLTRSAPRRRSSAASRPACTERACALYAPAVDTLVPVSSPEAAELTKLLENIFRSVNIALVNELAMLCDRHRARRLGGARRGGHEAVRLHAASRPAPGSAATASRSTRSTSPGRRASSTSRPSSSSSPARSTRTCRTSACEKIARALNRQARSLHGSQRAACSASPTSPTSTTRASRRRSS